MDPNDLIKAAPAIAKGAAEIIAAVPLADIVKRICGPPADLLGDKLKERVERCFEKTARMTQDAGFTPLTVSPKLLFPILQGASVEEDEDLHTMWAALLANAASTEAGNIVRPGFIANLRQMAPDEALLLKWIQHSVVTDHNARFSQLQFSTAFTALGYDDAHRLVTCLDGLEAAQLIRRHEDDPTSVDNSCGVMLTDRGLAFIRACQPPKPKS